MTAKPQRIVLATTELRPGGAERCLVDLATHLDPSRFESSVYILSRPPANGQGQLVTRLRESHVPVRFLGATHWSQMPWVFRELRRSLHRDRPVLLQTFLFHANLLGAIAAKPVVPHVVAGIRVAEPQRSRLWLQKQLCRSVDRFVCVSHDVAEDAARRGRLDADKLSVIPTGVDVHRLSRTQPASLKQFGIAGDCRPILFAGRADRQKGIDTLLRIAPQLLEQLPRQHLLCVGRGMRQAALSRRVRRLSCASRMHLVDWRPDMPEVMRACQLLLLPSRWEGMPRVLLEAMACGLAVMAMDVHGVREALGAHAAGQVVNAGSREEFLAAAVTLASKPEQCRELGLRNQRHVAESFSLTAMVAAYEQLFTSLMT